jgi:hypothetical protein
MRPLVIQNPSLVNALQRLVQLTPPPPVASISYVEDERALAPTGAIAAAEALLQALALAGVSVLSGPPPSFYF